MASEMKYNIQQRIFLYDSYVKYSSYKKCARKFGQKYPGFIVPSKSTIYRIVQKVRRTGTVLNKPRRRARHVLTEEMLDNIGAQLEANPNISTRNIAHQFGVGQGTAHTAKVLLNKLRQVCVEGARYVVIGVCRYRIIFYELGLWAFMACYRVSFTFTFHALGSFIVLGSMFKPNLYTSNTPPA
jgi:transposase